MKPLKGIIMQLSFLLDSMLSQPASSCIVSTRAPDRQSAALRPLGSMGAVHAWPPLPHRACEFQLRGQKEKAPRAYVCVGQRSCAHRLAGQGLSQGSIFISDFDNCLYVLKTKMTSF